MKKLFPPFPSSFWAGVTIFLIPALIIFSSKPLGPYAFPHPVIFYLSIFFSVVIIIGVIGWGNLIEYLGFDVTGPGERLSQVWWRYPLGAFIGFISGYGIFKVVSSGGLAIFPFPMDASLAQYFVSVPLIFSSLNWVVVAVFEEIMRNSGFFIFSNWIYKRTGDKGFSLLGGITIASLFFILLHLVSWGFTPNIGSYFSGWVLSILMSCLGFIFYAEGLIGKRAFMEFSIIPPIFFHFTWDLLVDLQMRVYPGLLPLALGIVG